MLIVLCAIAILAEILAALWVLASGGGWGLACAAALGAGCAAVLGAAAIANASQHIRAGRARADRLLTNDM